MNVDNELHKQLIMNQIPPPIFISSNQKLNNENNTEYINFNYYRDNITHSKKIGRAHV